MVKHLLCNSDELRGEHKIPNPLVKGTGTGLALPLTKETGGI